MKGDFKRLPRILKKNILCKLGLGLLFLTVFILMCIFMDHLVFALAPGAFALFALMDGIGMTFRCLSGEYLELDGICTEVYKSKLRRKTRSIAVETKRGVIKLHLMPSVAPREWAQTAAIGIALRNAGFGLQFSMAGESFSANAPDEFALDVGSGAVTFANESDGAENGTPSVTAAEPASTPVEAPPKELSAEEKFQLACKVPCTLKKYEGRTLGDIMYLDRNFLVYIATKYEGNEKLKEAAKIICEYAASNAA